MPKKFFFFIGRTERRRSPNVKRGTFLREQDRLVIVDAPTLEDAEEKLPHYFPRTSFAAKSIGYMTPEEVFDGFIPPSTLDNPIQVISALRYIADEYAPTLSVKDTQSLRRIERKLTRDFFR